MQDTKSEKIKKADLDPTLRTLGTLTKGGIKLKPTKDKPTTHMLSNKKNLLISDFPKMSYAGYRLGTADGGRNVLLDKPCRHIHVPPFPLDSFLVKRLLKLSTFLH